MSKLGQVVDDAKESRGWLQLLTEDAALKNSPHLPWLFNEADELTRIFAKSYRTARANNLRRKAEEKQNRQKRHNRPPPGTDEKPDEDAMSR